MSLKRSDSVSLTCVLLLSSIFLASGPLIADGTPRISPISQERYVETSASVSAGAATDGDDDYDEAQDHTSFVSGVSSYASVSGGSGGAIARGQASQSSTIGTDWIESHSRTSFDLGGSGFDAHAAGRGTSEMSVTFLLNEESDYVLQGTLNSGYGGLEYVSLTGPAGSIHEIHIWYPVAVQEWGTLPAGEYTFEVRSQAADNVFYLGTAIFGDSEHDVVLQFGPPGWAGPGGEVPDGSDVPGGPPVQVERLDDGFVHLSWGRSCRAGDGDYAVYEGVLGDPRSLVPVICSTAGQLEHEFQPVEDAAWFVVVPTDGVTEGSYGDTSEGAERVPSSTACWPLQLGEPVCP